MDMVGELEERIVDFRGEVFLRDEDVAGRLRPVEGEEVMVLSFCSM